MKQWIFIALALTITIGGCGSFSQQQEEQEQLNATSRFRWQFTDAGEWVDLTLEQWQNFIAAGVNVNTKGGQQNATPLHFIAYNNGNTDVIKELINAGADVNAKDYGDRTPLHWAAGGNANADVIKELINAGADVDDKGEGWTPLHVAAEYSGNADVIKELINAGADIDAKDDHYGETPCDLLTENGTRIPDQEAWQLLCDYR